MPRNTLDDLNNHLFEQMERLNDDSLTDEALEKEIARGKAMSGIATKIIDISNTELAAAKMKTEYSHSSIPLMIEGGNNGKKTTN